MSLPSLVVLDARAARELTERIRDAVEDLWRLLEVAHAGGAWKVLGYDSWSAYVQTEFAMSKQHSYRLLDQAHVIRELESAAGESPMGDLCERQTRAIKPVLPEVVERVKAEPERVEEIVREAVAEHMAKRGRHPDGRSMTADELPPPIPRPYVPPGTTEVCPRCEGAGKVRVW